MNVSEKLLFINEADVLKLLTPADAIAAAEDTFYHIGTGEITVGQMALMYADKEQKNNFHSMPAILHHRNFAGVKCTKPLAFARATIFSIVFSMSVPNLSCSIFVLL